MYQYSFYDQNQVGTVSEGLAALTQHRHTETDNQVVGFLRWTSGMPTKVLIIMTGDEWLAWKAVNGHQPVPPPICDPYAGKRDTLIVPHKVLPNLSNT